MTRELQLEFHKDGKYWELAGVGTLRATNWLGREFIAAAPGREEWRIKRAVAIDPTGAEVVRIADDVISYRDRELQLRGGEPGWTTGRKPYVLTEGDRELARFEPIQWARDKPPHVTIVDEQFAHEEPLLLLYAGLLAARAAGRNAAAAGAGSVTT